MADYLTFQNIYEAIERIVKKLKGSQQTLIKEIANMAYFEMLGSETLYPFFWLRDFDDSLYALAPSTISGITQADPAVITTSAAHGLTVGDIISIYNITGMTELNNRTYKVNTVPTTTTLTLIDLDGSDAIDSSAYTAYSSDGNIVHRGLTLATSGKNVERILSCAFHDYTDNLIEITPKELEETTKWWNDNTSRPQRYLHRKTYTLADGTETNQILWFPGSDAAYDFRYWLEKRVSPLANDADVPQLPPRFHYGIIAGAVSRLIEMDVQVENAVIWPGIYKAHIEGLRKFNRKFYQDNDVAFREKPFLL